MELPIWIDFFVREDNRGQILVTNFDDLPFSPKRIFYTSVNASGQERGGHSHKACWQILFCLNGEVEIKCIWPGGFKVYNLTKFGQALLIPPGIWSKQSFSSDAAILGVIASHLYDPSDYVYQTP